MKIWIPGSTRDGWTGNDNIEDGQTGNDGVDGVVS